MTRNARVAVPPVGPRTLSNGMRAILASLFAYGLHAWDPVTFVNAGVALAVTFLPALLERRYRLSIDPLLATWIVLAALVHSFGSAGFYGSVGWWDHLTHALSASLVTAVGYVTLSAMVVHSEEIHLPRRFLFGYVLVFVLAFGVLWELFEYGLDVLSHATGMTMPLAPHGLEDTVKDLSVNAASGLVVVVLGHAYLAGVAERLRGG